MTLSLLYEEVEEVIYSRVIIIEGVLIDTIKTVGVDVN